MVMYCALRDLKSFYEKEKNVFCWLLIGMLTCAFVLNFSYSFARYRGDYYSYCTGADVASYKVTKTEGMSVSDILGIENEIEEESYPKITQMIYLTASKDGHRLAGARKLNKNQNLLSGLWFEGYAREDFSDNGCAVNYSLLDYDGRLKMTGEKYNVDGKEYVIEGVYESLVGVADIIISENAYEKNYGKANTVYFIFEEMLNKEQEETLRALVSENFGDVIFETPAFDGNAEAITESNQLQYSIMIILMAVFLASIVSYWFRVNKRTYAIYWLTGMKNKKIIRILCTEVIILCSGCYIVGLFLNMLIRLLFNYIPALTFKDFMIGILVYFGTILLLSLVKISEICKEIHITDIKGEW